MSVYSESVSYLISHMMNFQNGDNKYNKNSGNDVLQLIILSKLEFLFQFPFHKNYCMHVSIALLLSFSLELDNVCNVFIVRLQSH
uniref:Intersectin-1-like n=1 Tax=Rhizophora mucronata TaxID=61149 RepID=A0A2P2LXQ4_RHIMU